ncbi:LiaG family protein [Jeotgalibacillus proteolyticus]|uniref:LiaG family protein n=1 Tax=Jeotgalibacillus proteolyticus TaxID=2082395 RepID=UPI001430F96F|nr:DUF4097 family beta strand repeat-containing protein [Jeotgalibacillus proteolyticus]
MAILLILGGLVVFYVNFNEYLPWSNSASAEQEKEIDEGIESIEITLGSIGAKLIPTDSGIVRVEGDKNQEVTIDERRGKIEIEVKPKGLSFFNFNFKDDDVLIYLPMSYSNDLDITLGSGQIVTQYDKSDPLVLNSLSFNLGSGRAVVENIQTDDFSFKGSSGFLSIDNMSTKNSDIEVSSGKIEIDSYVGPLNATLSSGLLEANIKELTGPVDVTVSSGAATLKLPEDADFKLNGTTGSGIITSSYPLQDKKTENGKMTGYSGEGTHSITLKASSGVVRVQ